MPIEKSDCSSTESINHCLQGLRYEIQSDKVSYVCLLHIKNGKKYLCENCNGNRKETDISSKENDLVERMISDGIRLINKHYQGLHYFGRFLYWNVDLSFDDNQIISSGEDFYPKELYSLNKFMRGIGMLIPKSFT